MILPLISTTVSALHPNSANCILGPHYAVAMAVSIGKMLMLRFQIPE
jgi:hypothetical protein